MNIYSEQLKEKRLGLIGSYIELIIKYYDKKAYMELLNFLKIMPNDIEEIAVDEELFKLYVENCHQISNRALNRKLDNAIKKIKKQSSKHDENLLDNK